MVGRSVVPSYTAALHRFVDELGLRDAVPFSGALSDAALADAVADADVFVLASRHEGFGVPVLEAMASGVPVVANDAGALPEVVGDGGLLVDAADPYALAEAVARVRREAGLRGALARRRRRRVAALDLPAAGDRAVDLLVALRSADRWPALGAQAPTACWTRETKRRWRRPGRTRRPLPPGRRQHLAQRRVAQHAPHGGGERHGRLVGQHQTGAADGLGHGGDAVGDDRDAVAHGLGQRHAEALVVRRHHEDVGRPEVGLELGAGDRTRQVHDVAQPELVDERAQRRLVGLAERRADQMQPGRRVVGAPEHVEHLDEVVRRLVRRDLPDVEQVGPTLALFAGGQLRANSGSGSSLLDCMSMSSGTTAVPS